MLQLLKNPTEPIFMNLISNAKSDVVLCAPFIKKEVITKILEIKNSNTRLTFSLLSKYGFVKFDMSKEIYLGIGFDEADIENNYALKYNLERNKI